MKPESKKRLLFSTARIVTAIITIVFAVLSILYVENWLFRIITQGSLSVTMLFNGLQTFAEQKHKTLGYLFIGVAAFLLYVMINTIIIGIKIGGL